MTTRRCHYGVAAGVWSGSDANRAESPTASERQAGGPDLGWTNRTGRSTLDRGHDNGFRPARDRPQRSDLLYGTAAHAQQQPRCGTARACRRRLHAVVKNVEAREAREQPDEISSTALVPFPDLRLGNVMAASRDPRPNAREMQFDAFETNVAHTDLQPSIDRRFEEESDGCTAECCLECEVGVSRDGTLEETFPLLPGSRIRGSERTPGIRGEEALRGLVRIEVRAARSTYSRSGDAALARPIHPCDDGDPPRRAEAR